MRQRLVYKFFISNLIYVSAWIDGIIIEYNLYSLLVYCDNPKSFQRKEHYDQ